MSHTSRVGGLAAGATTVALIAAMLTSASTATAAPSDRAAAARDNARAAIASHQGAFRATGQDAFTDRGQVVLDAGGASHARFDRTYRGLPVLGGDVVVHLDRDGGYDGASLTMARPLSLPTTARVSRDAAVDTARAAFDGAIESVSARRVVDATTTRPALAWEVTVTGTRTDQTPSVLHVLVDAGTGAVRSKADEVKQGTGNSIYAGTVTIGTSGSAGSYSMTDTARGSGTTTDMNGGTVGNGTTFTDADDVWGNGTVSSRQSAGVDAHYGAALTYDYFKNTHGRNGIFGDGRGVRSRVHYGNAYVNAFWDGTQMTYGDGAGNAKPLVSIDIAGHEMTHGVTENTANLTYSGESGGLNEANSDIFGTAVEFAAGNASDVGDYLIGEKVDINGNGTPLRYMDRPSRDGASKDCWYSGIGSIDVHYSSGPGNHMFYLLAEGSGTKTINGVSYTSTMCNGASMTGIGRDAAARIWYRALSVYMTSSTNYAGARTAAVNAAKDLYGATSAQCAGVENAFNGISVSGTTCGTQPPPSGNLLANPGFESGATSWTQTTGVITNDATRSRTGSWLGWLDGYGTTHTDTLSQSVTIPAGTSASLSLWLKVTTAESGTTPYDTLRVQVVNGTTTTTLATYSNANASSGYVQRTFSMTPYLGKTITIQLVGSEDASLATSFFVDDFSLTKS